MTTDEEQSAYEKKMERRFQHLKMAQERFNKEAKKKARRKKIMDCIMKVLSVLSH